MLEENGIPHDFVPPLIIKILLWLHKGNIRIHTSCDKWVDCHVGTINVTSFEGERRTVIMNDGDGGYRD